MNVAISVFYRDADNYKSAYEHVFLGPLNPKDILRMEKALDPNLGFIPTALDLPHAMLCDEDSKRQESDTPWHDINGVKATSDDAEDERTFAQFVNELEAADWEAASIQWEIDNPQNSDDDT